MVIVKLIGGLGNQMFQYAASRSISLSHDVPLKLDLSWFENVGNDTKREYELKHLAIKEEFASGEEIKKIAKSWGPQNIFRRFENRFLPLRRRSYITQRGTGFDPEMRRLKDNIYLDGFWSNENYFSDIREILMDEFQLRNPSDGVNKNMAEQLRTLNSVSIHVRRGDYVANPVTNQYHGLCSVQYYERAIYEITQSVKDPHFFLFSDDPQWVKDHIKISHPAVYVNHNPPAKGHEDLELMKTCKHQIIANSSFSWWAAWLNPNPGKIIYAPARWSNKLPDNKDVIPAQWISV